MSNVFESEHDTQVREHGYRDGWKDGYDAGYKAAWTEVDEQEAVEDSERRDLFEKIINVCAEARNQEVLKSLKFTFRLIQDIAERGLEITKK